MKLSKIGILKIGLYIVTVLLIGITLFLIIAGGLGIILIVGSGILLAYNLAILVALKMYLKKKPENHVVFYVLWLLFLLPIAWALIDFEGLVNFLLQGISLDMK